MNFENLTRAELIAARVQCDDSLLFFTRFWFRILRGSKFIVNKHHEIICDNLKSIETYDIELLNINIPPRFSKTELAAVNMIARGIGMNPCSNWLYITASDELRAQTSVSIRDIVQHPYFKIMYGVELKKDQNGKNLWRTNKGGGLKTATIFGQITGFGAGQMIEHDADLEDYMRHFEGCIVLDDLNKIDDSGQENANNEKVSRVLINTVLSRKNSKDTPIINIQQRAGVKDATAIFQDYYGESIKAKFLIMPVISELGEYLWEWKCGAEEIERLKNKSLNTFQTQYMQNPLPIDGVLLPISVIKFADTTKFDKDCIILKASFTDPADEGGDAYTSIFVDVIVIEDKLRVLVKDVIHSGSGVDAEAIRTSEKDKIYSSQESYVETNGLGVSAYGTLKRNKSDNCTIKGLHSRLDKKVRIKAGYEFVRDNFIFDSNYISNPEYAKFIKHLTEYADEGDNKHKKDAIDVCTMAAAVFKIKYKSILYI